MVNNNYDVFYSAVILEVLSVLLKDTSVKMKTQTHTLLIRNTRALVWCGVLIHSAIKHSLKN